MSIYEEVLEQELRDLTHPVDLLPYSKVGLPSRLAGILNKEVAGGVRVGDLLPVVSSVPEGQAPWEEIQRPRETWQDWATLPAEVLGLLNIGPKSPSPKARTGILAPEEWVTRTMPDTESMLDIAKEAEASGLPMERIRDATNWYRDESGWLYEINDKDLRVENPPTFPFRSTSFKEAVQHPFLYELDPSFEKVKLKHSRNPYLKGEYFYRHQRYPFSPEEIRLNPKTAEKSSGTLPAMAHEIQHALDYRRPGVSFGSNAETAAGLRRYLENPGEQRAFAVEHHQPLTPDEVRMSPARYTADQIFRMEGLLGDLP